MTAPGFRGSKVLVLALTLTGAAAARADDPITWPFEVQTTGQDVHWVSPTHVNPIADQYILSYVITRVEVTVRYLFIQITQDVTGQIPPEYLSGSGVFRGPAPVLLYEGDLIYPNPPEPPAISAHLEIGLNVGAFGYFDMTDVYLGTLVMNVPPFGNVTVHIEKIHCWGSVTAQAMTYPLGDMDCSGSTDFADINPFVLALSDPAGYQAAFPACPIAKGDINGDGLVSFSDINPFVALLTGQ